MLLSALKNTNRSTVLRELCDKKLAASHIASQRMNFANFAFLKDYAK